MDEVYSAVNQDGQRDAVRVMRQGLGHNLQGGVTDPVYPIRHPDVIVPVWYPAHTNTQLGIREEGQWKHHIDEEATWAR